MVPEESSAAQVVSELIQRVNLDGAIDVHRVTAVDVALAAGVIGLALILAGFTRRWVRRAVGAWDQAPDYVAPVAARFASWGVILVGVVVAVDFLGVDLNNLLLFVVIVTVIMAFAGRDLLRNMAAASVLQTRGPFHVGEQIRFGPEEGTVNEVNARTTVLTNVEGERIYLPNIDLLNGTLINLSSVGSRRSSLVVSVDYKTDLRDAQSVLEESMEALHEVHASPAPRALIADLADSTIDIELLFWHGPLIDQAREARSVVAVAAREALREHGIVIAFPQRVLSLTDPADRLLRDLIVS